MSFETALAVVKRKRACVKPNSGFMKALQEWDVVCHGIGRGGGDVTSFLFWETQHEF